MKEGAFWHHLQTFFFFKIKPSSFKEYVFLDEKTCLLIYVSPLLETGENFITDRNCRLDHLEPRFYHLLNGDKKGPCLTESPTWLPGWSAYPGLLRTFLALTGKSCIPECPHSRDNLDDVPHHGVSPYVPDRENHLCAFAKNTDPGSQPDFLVRRS